MGTERHRKCSGPFVPPLDLIAGMRWRGFVIAEQLIVAIADKWIGRSAARDAEGGVFTDSIAYNRNWIGKDGNTLRVFYHRVVGNLAGGLDAGAYT
jgi:hypothetical protein